MLAGQVIKGGVVSVTVTVNEQLDWLPDESVAVEVTVVTPRGNAEPEGGKFTTFPLGQLLSVAVTV
jgi:hypothetical protein